MQNQVDMRETDEVLIVGEEIKQQNFIPLSAEKKRELCKELDLPYCDFDCDQKSSSVNHLDKPSNCKEIQQDGNCFLGQYHSVLQTQRIITNVFVKSFVNIY